MSNPFFNHHTHYQPVTKLSKDHFATFELYQHEEDEHRFLTEKECTLREAISHARKLARIHHFPVRISFWDVEAEDYLRAGVMQFWTDEETEPEELVPFEQPEQTEAPAEPETESEPEAEPAHEEPRTQSETFHTETARTATYRQDIAHAERHPEDPALTLTTRAFFNVSGIDSPLEHESYCQLHSAIRWARRQILAGKAPAFKVYQVETYPGGIQHYVSICIVEKVFTEQTEAAQLADEEASTAAESTPAISPIPCPATRPEYHAPDFTFFANDGRTIWGEKIQDLEDVLNEMQECLAFSYIFIVLTTVLSLVAHFA